MPISQWILDERKFLSTREVRRLLRTAKARAEENGHAPGKIAVRNYLILDLALSTGLRVSEIAKPITLSTPPTNVKITPLLQIPSISLAGIKKIIARIIIAIMKVKKKPRKYCQLWSGMNPSTLDSSG